MVRGHCDIAGCYRLALELGLLPADAPVMWADAEIAAAAEPDLLIIELSLAAGKPVDRVIDALRPLTPVFSSQAIRMLGALLLRQFEAGAMSEFQIARLLYRLTMHCPEADTVLGPEIYVMDEYFEPYMTDDVSGAQEVRRFLAQFADVRLPSDV